MNKLAVSIKRKRVTREVEAGREMEEAERSRVEVEAERADGEQI
jgi:hypothetical protein